MAKLEFKPGDIVEIPSSNGDKVYIDEVVSLEEYLANTATDEDNLSMDYVTFTKYLGSLHPNGNFEAEAKQRYFEHTFSETQRFKLNEKFVKAQAINKEVKDWLS